MSDGNEDEWKNVLDIGRCICPTLWEILLRMRARRAFQCKLPRFRAAWPGGIMTSRESFERRKMTPQTHDMGELFIAILEASHWQVRLWT